ncbi:hypothetical protein E2C01_060995 [Portunus trituberculatus]|uniref:Uncharacterized protein n=1 Tax=Portunus trituberculatus TaxID=210409 RepID=A0A5B7H425_PORTR|nr:hypothetical protein [Portunus trituberculatus]
MAALSTHSKTPLTSWVPPLAVPEKCNLQHAVDARFTFDEWDTLTQQEALNAIGLCVMLMRQLASMPQAGARGRNLVVWLALHRLWKMRIVCVTLQPTQPARPRPRVPAGTVAPCMPLTIRISCPAREAVCLGCRKWGQFKRCCRGLKHPNNAMPTNAVLGAVTIADTQVTSQTTMEVTVAFGGGANHHTVAVTDTGAQVHATGCMAAVQPPH